MKKIITSSIVLMIVSLLSFLPNKPNNQLEIPTSIEYVSQNVQTHTIYLLDNNNYISKTSIKIRSEDKEDIARELLETMIQEGKNSDQIPSGFLPIIPSNTKINALSIQEDTLKVDVSAEFLNTSKELEEKLIEAVVYTLTSIDGIQNIILYVDGNILTKLPQTKINLPTTLNRQIGINKTYQLTALTNVTATNIYYIRKYNDNYFYTPVTKITNDNREKIEIIIEELSSSVPQNNLMSFLNSNTQLLNFTIDYDQMIICFDEYIFNDLETKDILEEVLDTISLSIYDNYPVEEVIFQVDNQEIAKTTVKSIE